MTHREHLQQLLTNHRRRLAKLRERYALQGYNTDPRILLEIEDIEVEIQRLEAELDALTEIKRLISEDARWLIRLNIESLIKLLLKIASYLLRQNASK